MQGKIQKSYQMHPRSALPTYLPTNLLKCFSFVGLFPAFHWKRHVFYTYKTYQKGFFCLISRFCYCQLSWICVNATYYIYNNQRTSRFSLFLSKLYVYLSPIVWKTKVTPSNLKTRFFIFPITSGIFQPIFSYFIFF